MSGPEGFDSNPTPGEGLGGKERGRTRPFSLPEKRIEFRDGQLIESLEEERSKLLQYHLGNLARLANEPDFPGKHVELTSPRYVGAIHHLEEKLAQGPNHFPEGMNVEASGSILVGLEEKRTPEGRSAVTYKALPAGYRIKGTVVAPHVMPFPSERERAWIFDRSHSRSRESADGFALDRWELVLKLANPRLITGASKPVAFNNETAAFIPLSGPVLLEQRFAA